MTDMSKKKVGVLMGGLSAEREVSLDTGKGVLAGLLEAGVDAHALTWDEGDDIAAKIKSAGVEVIWNALHGTDGEDGAIQGLLQCLNIPYTGSGVAGSGVAMDKVMSKILFAHHDIPTPQWARPEKGDRLWLDQGVVVKPSQEGSSFGVTIVKDANHLAPAIEYAYEFHGEPIIEAYIAGTEVFVGVLDGEALGAVEVRPKTAFYDYEAKYKRDDTEYLIPPQVSAETLAACKKYALQAFEALGCECYGRVDMRVDEAGKPWIIEVNTLPGMTATSLLPKIAKHAGISYAELCVRILALAHT